jgi:hypothetical protein
MAGAGIWILDGLLMQAAPVGEWSRFRRKFLAARAPEHRCASAS